MIWVHNSKVKQHINRKPKNRSYQRVPNLIIRAATTAILEDKPKIIRSPDNVASTTPKPPGIKLTAPASEVKLNKKVESTIPIDSPNP